MNDFHFKPLPMISDNVIRLPFILEPSSSIECEENEGEKKTNRLKLSQIKEKSHKIDYLVKAGILRKL